MRLGISSYTYVWSVGVSGYPMPAEPLSVFELLEKAVQLDVGVVQIADNLPLDELSDSELDDLSQRAKVLNIGIEVGARGIRADHLLAYLNLALRFESPILRVVVDSECYEPTTKMTVSQPSIENIVASLRQVVGQFERAGVKVAIENHDRFRAETLVTILDQIGSDHVGVCFDTANSIGCLESPDVVMDTVGSRIVNLHLKDFRIRRPPYNKGFVVEGQPAGMGQLDIPRTLRKLQELGCDVNAILELWPPPQKTLAGSIELENAWAKESIQYLRKFIPD